MKESILNDLAILGLPSRKKVKIGRGDLETDVEIDIVGVQLNEEELEELKFEFERSVKFREFEFGNTYAFVSKSTYPNSPKLKSYMSSSIEELWEMFKADRTGQVVPPRKAFISMICVNGLYKRITK